MFEFRCAAQPLRAVALVAFQTQRRFARTVLTSGSSLTSALSRSSPVLWLCPLAVLYLLTLGFSGQRLAHAAEPTTFRIPGLSLPQGNQDKARAKERIPWDRLDREDAEKVRRVVQQCSVFRRMPQQKIASEVDLYDFLLQHPETVVDMWRVMGVTKATLTPAGQDAFTANDGAGTTCDIDVVYRDPHLLVMHTSGKYEGPLYHRPLHGDCVILLTSTYHDIDVRDPQSREPRDIVVNMDAFVKLHNATVELIARTLKPVFGRISDHNFAETTAFLGSVSQTARENPTGMLQLAEKLPTVTDDTRRKYESILLNIAERSDDFDLPLPLRSAPLRTAPLKTAQGALRPEDGVVKE